MARTIPHSVKRPLQNRIWFKYPNQPNHIQAGDGDRPSETAQVLENGTTQIRQATYNSRGMVTSTTDPAGRTTTYTYAGNGIDLLEVRQVNGGSTDLLASYANYTAHRPGTITDAAGEDTVVTYNAAGQPLTVTNAKSEVTTSVYDSDGYLQTVTGPVSGSTTTYGYDAVGRVTSILEPDATRSKWSTTR